MITISIEEFNSLKERASHLNHYWQLFRAMDTAGKINFPYSFFIRDFISHKRLAEATAIKQLAHNSTLVQLSEKQFFYLKEAATISDQLALIVNTIENQPNT